MSTDMACSVDDHAWRPNHVWSHARQVALANAGWACAICRITDWEATLQVHHLEPVARDGTGYDPGCQHHQSNLVVLCELHHRAEHRGMRARPDTQLALFASTAA